MPVPNDLGANVADITARLNRLRAVTMARDVAAVTVELDGLAHALQYLDLVLKVHLQIGATVANHDEIVDYLDLVRAELREYMKHRGMPPQQNSSKPSP